MPQNFSLLSQEPQEQVLPSLLKGFSQTLDLLVFLEKTLTLTPFLHQHKNPSTLDKSANYNEEELHMEETNLLKFTSLKHYVNDQCDQDDEKNIRLCCPFI